MAKLWQKSGKKLHPLVEKYTVATDDVFDVLLMPFDITVCKTHAKGLKQIGILTARELKSLLDALAQLEQDCKEGAVRITKADEDSHTVIENYLVKKLGAVGKKIHTGRSRNEVIVAMRLYMKDALGQSRKQCLHLAREFLDMADEHKNIPMAGYSHTQQAMLSSIGHYFSAFAESMLDDSDVLHLAKMHLDKSPLGSAAGFGVSLPLDRVYTAKELGFGSIQINSLYCQNSRGKFESLYMEALAQVMLTLGRFANDMLLFTSQEFDFFLIDDSLVTGSSIMPHKRNLDAMEILRGNVSVVIANQLMVKDIAKNLLSGYNRDGQLMKKPIFESTQIVLDSLKIVELILKGLTPKTDRIIANIRMGIFTADIANDLVSKKGVPFRDAYRQAADTDVGNINLMANIASKKSLGAPGNLGLKLLRKRVSKLSI
ncbi:MAG: argininosuccinate lyase [Parcubacteria group bacterium Gr01-1014_8]|nr:MAG: argininosuccinate lyase [Parcubacteria group bacterium Gr01-1014_8]